MNNEVWVRGATGRTGRAVATRLHEAGVPLVLVGRDARLDGVVAELGGIPRLLVGTLASALGELARDAPGVVVNTVGPFTTTAVDVARACPPGTHYVDMANELPAVEALGLYRQAAATDQVFVTGAGFGVLAIESVVLRLCAGLQRPSLVRVDAPASVATEAEVLGSALAVTIVEILALGGRQIRQGRLVRSRVATDLTRLTTPDGDVLSPASGANGELIAAWRASNADSVIAASTAAPSSAIVGYVLPAVVPISRIPSVGRFAASRIARIRLRAQGMPRPFVMGTRPRGMVIRDSPRRWLRVGDGHTFTAASPPRSRNDCSEGRVGPGRTPPPAALFGPELAEAVGGPFLIDEDRGSPQSR